MKLAEFSLVLARKRLIPLLLSALVVISVAALLHRNRVSRAQTATSTSSISTMPKATPHEVDFPYYSLREGYDSTLFLVSDSPQAIDLTVAVRGRMGETVAAQTTIQPQQKLPVELRQLLTRLGADVDGTFAEGSVAVSYVASGSRPVVGQMTITNPALSLVHESEMVENDPAHSEIPPVLNSLWWGLAAGRDAKVFISNMSADSVTADVFLDFAGKQHPSADGPLTFIAHETKVISILELLGKMDFSPAQAPEGGITIIARSSNPALIASGRMTESSTGFSTTLHFLNPHFQVTSALAASGVPLGPQGADSPFGQGGTFIPHVVLRNLLSTPQNATVTVEYPGTESTQQIVLPSVALGPYATEDLSLESLVAQLPQPVPYASIRIQYSGAPGSVVAEVASVEEKQDLVVDNRLANEGDGLSRSGANPWHLDEQTESVLFLTNVSDQPARIGFQVVANGVHYYLTELKLNPHETRAIDLRKLRDAQKADFKGNKIPAAATDGTVNWIRLSNVPVVGRLVVINRNTGVASNYDCTTCPCRADYSNLSVSPSSANILAGGTQQFTATATYGDCNGVSSYYNVSSVAAWSSNNSAVATVNATGLATGVAGGSATLTATYGDCLYSPDPVVPRNCDCTLIYLSANATVNVTAPFPTGFVQSGSSGGGGFLLFTYRWSSSTGNVADLQNCQVGELVTYPGYQPGQQLTFFWPFDVWSASSPNPTVGSVPGNASCLDLTPACVQDQQLHGAFISNPTSDGFTAYQTWRYQCPGVNNGNFVTLQGPDAIQRSVSCVGSNCTYTITKTGSSSSCQIGVSCN